MSKPGARWSDAERIKRRTGGDGRVRDFAGVHSERRPTVAFKQTRTQPTYDILPTSPMLKIYFKN